MRAGAPGPERTRRTRWARRGGLTTLSLLLGGCTTTLPLSSAPTPEEAAVRFLDNGGEGRTGWVEMGDSVFLAGRLRVDPIGRRLSFRRFSGDSVAVPLHGVRAVETTNHARGALEGLGAAVVTSLVVGAIAAAVDDGQGERSRGQQALRAGGIAAVFTLPVGFVIGIGGGHRTVIQIQAGGPD